MKNIETIVERVIEISEEPEFIRENLSYLGGEEELTKNTHAHVIHAQLPDGIFFIHGYCLDRDHFKDDVYKDDVFKKLIENHEKTLKLGFREDLVNILKKGEPKTFTDLLILLTLYFSLEGRSKIDNGKYSLPLQPFPSQNSIVDEILHETKGHLLWRDQLDRLIGLFEQDGGVRRELIRYSNGLKKEMFREWSATKLLENGLSLKDIIDERQMISWPGLQPPMAIAFRLYKVLFPKESLCQVV